jgi:two-component system, NtrC family, response regulator HupR/HoxA
MLRGASTPELVGTDPIRIAPRVPCFTPVVTPSLDRCWSSNLSASGIGLTGYVTTRGAPERDTELELELRLGPTHGVRTTGRVAWSTRIRADGRVALGVRFDEPNPRTRAALDRFVADHRPLVVVAMASVREKELARSVLRHVDLEFVDGRDELREEVLRSCSSMLVFAHDATALTAFVGMMWSEADERPRAPITLCTTVAPERLVPLVTDGRLFEVIRPPFDGKELADSIARSCDRWAMQVELGWAAMLLEGLALRQRPTERVSTPPQHAPHIVRASTRMQRAYELVRIVASHDVPALLVGETGTGKELAAREIHALSPRASTPFVAQDCGALTETLLESELFGHVRGAFTGATADHPGLFQVADGGTIFLDEIQNTSAALQAKLLRVVEHGEVRPVGGAKVRRVDVRLIAASNIDLRAAVREQRFRADFFYRLNRFPIELPPLREHPDDILPLARHFVATLCATMRRSPHALDAAFESALTAYAWPGNIRELRNAIERAILLSREGDALRVDTLPDEVRGRIEAPTGGLDAQMDAVERRLIENALDRHRGVIRRAAMELQVNAVTLARRMRRLGITLR